MASTASTFLSAGSIKSQSSSPGRRVRLWQKKVYKSITELVGNTPLVELTNYEKKLNLKAKIFAKLEYFNPESSVKDRIALNMLEKQSS